MVVFVGFRGTGLCQDEYGVNDNGSRLRNWLASIRDSEDSFRHRQAWTGGGCIIGGRFDWSSYGYFTHGENQYGALRNGYRLGGCLFYSRRFVFSNKRLQKFRYKIVRLYKESLSSAAGTGGHVDRAGFCNQVFFERNGIFAFVLCNCVVFRDLCSPCLFLLF